MKYSDDATIDFKVDNKVTVSDNMLVWAALLILMSVVIGLTVFFAARRRPQPMAPQEGYGSHIPPSDGDGPNEVQVPHPPAVGMAPEPASAGPERGRMAVVGSISVDELEETSAPRPEKTARERQADDLAAREGQILRALSSLPRGLPSSLWGMDIEVLAATVALAERSASPEGETIVRINTRWYYGDEKNLGLFMQQYKGPLR